MTLVASIGMQYGGESLLALPSRALQGHVPCP
jgi:hypothetical protein